MGRELPLKGFQPIPFLICLAIVGLSSYYTQHRHLPVVDGLISAVGLCCIYFAGVFDPLVRWRDRKYRTPEEPYP